MRGRGQTVRTEPTFETVKVERVNDGKVVEMSRKVFENVHKGGEVFRLAKAKKEATDG